MHLAKDILHNVLDRLLTPFLAIILTGVWLGLWWSSVFSGWEKLIGFNYYHEAIPEGIVLHLVMGWYVWLAVRQMWGFVRNLRRMRKGP